MSGEKDLNKAAEEHLRELEAHLERLKRQNAALDRLSEEQEVEMQDLKRMLAEAAERFRSG